MRKAIIGLVMVFVLGLTGAKAWAESFKLPDLPDLLTDEVMALDKKSGAFLWSSLDSFEKGKEKQKEKGKEIEKTFLRYFQKGSGKYGGSKDPIKWEIEGYYYADPYIRPYHSQKKIFSNKGKLLKIDTLYFDAKAGKIYFSSEDKISKKTTRQTFKLEKDIIDKYAMGTALSSYPFAKKKDFTFHYISDEPKVYSLTLHYKGKEKITVPAGTFECYKLEMTVDLGLLGIVSAFVPKTYFWYRVKDQQWIKYEGLESGLGTPYIVMQLAKEPAKTYLPRKKEENSKSK